MKERERRDVNSLLGSNRKLGGLGRGQSGLGRSGLVLRHTLGVGLEVVDVDVTTRVGQSAMEHIPWGVRYQYACALTSRLSCHCLEDR